MYEDRVAKGMDLLDRADPGWVDRIDLDRLEMASCGQCILGQLRGHYLDGFLEIVRPMHFSVRFSSAEYGFTLYDDEQGDFPHAEEEFREVMGRFHDLGLAWKSAILARRSVPVGS